MALTTYTELQAALAVWLDGASFSDREADFITLCEAEINARLATAIRDGRDIRPMIDRDTLSIDAEYVAIPDSDSDMILPKTIEVTGLDRPWQIDYVGADNLVGMRFGQAEERTAISGVIGSNPPRFYTVVGAYLRFFPAPETTFSSQFIRYVKVPALSGSVATNWVLTNHPNAYLYGALAQAELFGWNAQGGANWFTLFDQAVQGIVDRYPMPSNQAPIRSELAQFGGRGMSYNSFMAGGF